MTRPLTKFSSVITLSTTRTSDPASAGIDRFVGLEHIEPENLHIHSWGLVVDGTTFTNTFKRGQVLSGKRTSKVTFQQSVVQNTTICYNSFNPSR
ncbi:hypothetical protein MASR2M66_29600 [Chloroflexota bacterium]